MVNPLKGGTCVALITRVDWMGATSWLSPNIRSCKVEGKVFYGQEPPSGESTTTECGFNYQLLEVIY